MAYVTLLSIIPSLAATLSIIAIFQPFLASEVNGIEAVRNFILTNLAAGSGEEALKVIEDLLLQLNFTKIGVSSFIGLLLSLVLLLRQIENALNKIWLVKKGRNLFIRFIYFWTFLTLGSFLGSLAIGYLSQMGLAQALNIGGAKSTLSFIFEKLYAYFSGYIIFLFLYKAVPNIHVPFKHASIGAITSTVLLDLAGIAFTMYVTGFSSHRVIYGALAALPLFLFWLYICWVIILFGSLLSWRSAQGFKDAENDHLLLQPKTEADYFASLSVEGLSPLLCMIEVSRFFWKESPRPLFASDIETKLDLPAPWIARSLDLLDEQGLIRKVENEGRSYSYVPARPLEKFSIKEFYSLFELDPSSQLEKADDSISKQNKILVDALTKFVSDKPSMKLVEFLDSI